jgi:outer membrane lipoprotein-sorting protein
MAKTQTKNQPKNPDLEKTAFRFDIPEGVPTYRNESAIAF